MKPPLIVLYFALITLIIALSIGCAQEKLTPSCSVESAEGGAKVVCTDGTEEYIPGGASGDAGTDGSSCTVVREAEGSTISCTDGTETFVPNGMDGSDGQDGANGQDSILDLIDPCGDGPGPDEILIVLSDGNIIAWYKNLGLTILQCDTVYVTTDKQKCKFKITEDCKYSE